MLADYDPTWPTKFEEEKARILTVAGDYIADIQNVGSTSIQATLHGGNTC